MYDPKYDLPLAVGLSLAVSLIATHVGADNTLNPEHFIDGALASPPEIVDCELNDGTETPPSTSETSRPAGCRTSAHHTRESLN